MVESNKQEITEADLRARGDYRGTGRLDRPEGESPVKLVHLDFDTPPRGDRLVQPGSPEDTRVAARGVGAMHAGRDELGTGEPITDPINDVRRAVFAANALSVAAERRTQDAAAQVSGPEDAFLSNVDVLGGTPNRITGLR